MQMAGWSMPTPKPDHRDDYFNHAARLKSTLETMDGFVSVERFESVTQPGKDRKSVV